MSDSAYQLLQFACHAGDVKAAQEVLFSRRRTRGGSIVDRCDADGQVSGG